MYNRFFTRGGLVLLDVWWEQRAETTGSTSNERLPYLDADLNWWAMDDVTAYSPTSLEVLEFFESLRDPPLHFREIYPTAWIAAKLYVESLLV